MNTIDIIHRLELIDRTIAKDEENWDSATRAMYHLKKLTIEIMAEEHERRMQELDERIENLRVTRSETQKLTEFLKEVYKDIDNYGKDNKEEET